MDKLTAVILTLNESHHIIECIQSLVWCDRVVVLDSYSTDDTVPRAQSAGAEVIQHPWENYAQQRNHALDVVEAEWILFVDADERATSELAMEVRQVITDQPENGWWIPRYNYIFGHRMRATGWYPDYQLRLLRRGYARYDPNRAVHEVVVLDGKAGHLTSHLIHYNYDTVGQFIAKQRRYLDYDVKVLLTSGVQPHWYTPIAQTLRHTYWRLISLDGWKDGMWGLLLSLMMGYYEGLKYRRAWMETRRRYRHGR